LPVALGFCGRLFIRVNEAGDQPTNKREEEASGPQIGAILVERRKEKGLTLKDVEQATKIRTRYLEGLEREDYSLLPDAVYARGFLKTYANFLGLDGEQLAGELGEGRSPRRERHQQTAGYEPGAGWYEAPRRTRESEQPLLTPRGVIDAGRRRPLSTMILAIAVALLVLATVASVLYLIGSSRAQSTDGSDGEPKAPQDQQPAAGGETTFSAVSSSVGEETTSSAISSSAGEETTSKGVEVAIRTVGGSSGITVYTDGVAAYDGLAQPGFTQTFSGGESVTISARNAGVVEIEANGRNLGRLGNNGQPKTQTFTPSSFGT
jgi:cytoskeletal protein RodZ